VAEAQATLCAVEFSRDMGLKNIILKGDSLQVVNALKVKCPTTQIGVDMSNWWPMHKLSLLLDVGGKVVIIEE
jgi:ribonuclease HI